MQQMASSPVLTLKRRRIESQTDKGQSENGKYRAANICAILLTIGSWTKERDKRVGEVIAKFYFAKKKMLWEVIDKDGIKKKIEFDWKDIIGIRETFHVNTSRFILDVELADRPLFFKELEAQPKKHTVWIDLPDFTGGQATICRFHHMEFPESEPFKKYYNQLLQSDDRLRGLSQKHFPTSNHLYFPSDNVNYVPHPLQNTELYRHQIGMLTDPNSNNYIPSNTNLSQTTPNPFGMDLTQSAINNQCPWLMDHDHAALKLTQDILNRQELECFVAGHGVHHGLSNSDDNGDTDIHGGQLSHFSTFPQLPQLQSPQSDMQLPPPLLDACFPTNYVRDPFKPSDPNIGTSSGRRPSSSLPMLLPQSFDPARRFFN